VQEKRPGLANRKDIVFHRDNARSYTSLKTRKKLIELEQDVLPHPLYFPDLALSSYHLFRTLQKILGGKTLSEI